MPDEPQKIQQAVEFCQTTHVLARVLVVVRWIVRSLAHQSAPTREPTKLRPHPDEVVGGS